VSDLPLFSVICMVKDRAALIRKCVESVLAQDDPAVELVVQDGASSDGTLEILREYGDRIRLVSEPDAGAGDGLFRALRRARGELWGSCLSDEQLVPDAVSWARRMFAQHPGLGGIYGYAEGVDRDGTPLSRQDFGEFSLEDLLTYRQVPPFVASFFRMAAYRQVGLWDYTGGGEHDLWFRFAVRFPIRRFSKLVGYYGMDRSTLSSQTAMYRSERAARLEALRRLFHDDPAGRPYQYLEARAFGGYFLRYAGMFVRMGDWELARESFDQARSYWPACADDWLQDGAARVAVLEHQFSDSPTHELANYFESPLLQPAEAEELRMAWLHYTIDQPFNVWTLAAAMGIRRVAVFGGEGWGLALHRQLEPAGLTCVAVIENNASTRQAAMIPAPYFSPAEYLARGPSADAVVSSLQGDHDREVLSSLQRQLGPGVPVISWKMLFSLLAEVRTESPASEPVKHTTFNAETAEKTPMNSRRSLRALR
jgi:glycosyltransferase involved in cell wall biosynthesis